MVDGLADALTHRPLLALVTLFGAGLVTSLTPCIYPMIPITAGILAGTGAGQTSRARAARLTFAYVSGLALFYAILGLIPRLTGSPFGTVSGSPRRPLGPAAGRYGSRRSQAWHSSRWRSTTSCRWARFCDDTTAGFGACQRPRLPARAGRTGRRPATRYRGSGRDARRSRREDGGPGAVRGETARAARVLGHLVPAVQGARAIAQGGARQVRHQSEVRRRRRRGERDPGVDQAPPRESPVAVPGALRRGGGGGAGVPGAHHLVHRGARSGWYGGIHRRRRRAGYRRRAAAPARGLTIQPV